MLSQSRLSYQPHFLPHLKAIVFEKKKASPVQVEIQQLFPLTSDQPFVQGKPGKSHEFPALKIGAVFSGGQAAGGHNVLTGLFDALHELNASSQLVGFLDGPSGIVSNQHIELTASKLKAYRNQGGFDLLGSGRTKIETEEQLAATLKTARSLALDGLVVIGGDDSNTNAAVIAEYFLHHECPTRVIGVPKTIDGDLQNEHVAISFGFDTATKIYSELIGNICRDALSAKKYYHFVKLMGRSASHIALECGLKTHPNLVLITEEGKTFTQTVDQICDLIQKRADLKKNYGVILIPEGLAEGWDSLPESALLNKDPHGNVNLSAIETELFLIEAVKKRLPQLQALPHFFGYEGRAGLPTNFDANYCYTLGQAAALLVAHGFSSYMACVEHLTQPPSKWTIGGVPLATQMVMQERKGKLKPVIGKALVDLQGKPYLALKKHALQWALDDDYQYPGPIQFFGDPELTENVPLILQGQIKD